MMIALVLLIAIPSYFAFKRGHNGGGVTIVLLVAYVLSIFISESGLFASALAVFFVPWLMSLVYVFAGRGGEGDAFEALDEHHELVKDVHDEPAEVEEDEWVVVKTYGESWQQQDLMIDVQRMTDSGILFKSHGGLLASIMVHPGDFDKASELLADPG